MEMMAEEIDYIVQMKSGQKYRHSYEDYNKDVEVIKIAENRYQFSCQREGIMLCKENSINMEDMLKKWIMFIHCVSCVVM